MSQQQLDTQGEAREALRTAVASYGQRVLNDPHILGNLVADLLPDLPLERSLLTAGAEAGIAAEMMRYVHNQHIDPDTAVQLAARTLAERRAIDPAASMWVASEYGQALGFQARPYSLALQPGVPDGSPAPTTARVPAQSASTQPTAPAPVSPQLPPMPHPQGPQAQSWPQGPPGPQEQVWPPAQPVPADPPTSGRGRKRGVIAAAAAAGLVIVYLIVAAVAHTVPFGKSHPVAASTPTVRPTQHKPTPHPRPTGPTLAAGVAPLIQLLPSDVNPANCKAAPKAGWATPGLVKSLECYDSGVGTGDSIYAYQMDSSANYQASWANFNTWTGFSSSSTSSCPPSGGSTQGSLPWDDSGSGGSGFYPTAAGQTLECGYFFANTKHQNEPTYAWSFPSEDAYVIAIGDAGSSFARLQSWWVNNSDPSASPSPSTP
jgi:hypothetical protein